jgi:Ca-activated chloride channel homolog
VRSAARSVLVAAVLALALSTGPHAARAQVFRAGVEAVRVDVLVSVDGRPLSGLTPADFEVFDDGVPQQVDFASLEQMPLNVFFALDTSASVAGPTLAHLQKAGGAVLDKLTAGDQAALISFSHAVVLRSPLTPSFDRLRLAIRNVMPRGDTALVDAVFAGLVFAEADVGRKLLLVFTDGYDTSSYVRRQDVADAARSTDVVVYAVTAGVHGHRTAEFLSDIANLTGGGLVSVDSTSDVERAFLGILDEFRHRYLLSFTPSGVAKTGWHKLEVRVKGRHVAVKARTGYQAGF